MHRKIPLTTAALALALGVGSSTGPAAAIAQEIDLGQPVASFAEAFGLITGVRELSNGSVLLADPLGGMLVRIDPGLTSMETIGSEGEGPGEYRQPDGIWAIGGDNSLLVDLGNARLTVVDADGNLGDGDPIVIPGDGGGPGSIMMAIPGGTDADGNVYFTGGVYGPDGARDSIELYRVKPGSSEPRVVAMLKAPEMNVETSGGANNRNVSVSPVPLGAADTWGVAADGGVYIARVGDYSVEYISASGSRARGDAIDYRPVRIRMAEKEEWDDERARNGGVGVSVTIDNGRRQVSMSRATGRRSELNALDWPEDMPPFASARMRVDSEGNGWVRRNMKAGEPAVYDVFNTSGERVKSVRFLPDRALIGFGDGTVYAARTDEFDQQFLEKYDLP
ncbi:MAG: hypothetical protein ACC682_05085 [Gemmatimonadota bacterium]